MHIDLCLRYIPETDPCGLPASGPQHKHSYLLNLRKRRLEDNTCSSCRGKAKKDGDWVCKP